MSKEKIQALAAFMAGIAILVFLADAVCAVSYINKNTGGQVLWNVAGLYNDSSSSSFFSSCGAGSSIRSISYDGSVTCETDDYGSGTISYWYLYGDAGSSQQVDQGETVTIAGGTNGIDSVAGATNAVTLTFDSSELSTGAIPESAIRFSTTCTGDYLLDTGGGNLECVKELDPSVGTYSTNRVCYGSGSTVVCNADGLYWDSTNNRLGIGTVNPTTRLMVNGTGNVRVLVYSTGGNPGYDLASGSTYFNITMDAADSNKLKFTPGSGTPAVTFTTTGNVGVNESNPDCTLLARGSSNTYGCIGNSSGGVIYAVRGVASPGSYPAFGVLGSSANIGAYGNGIPIGAKGESVYVSGGPTEVKGVYGYASGGATQLWGGYFYPDVYIYDDLSVTNINNLAYHASILALGSGSHSSNLIIRGNLGVARGATLGVNAGDNEYNTLRVPTASSAPFTCNSNTEGALYIDSTATNRMYICSNGNWVAEATPELLDAAGARIDYVGIRLKQTDAVAKVLLPGYTFRSDFSFYLLNNQSEVEFFDEVHLNMRCYGKGRSMTVRSYGLEPDSPNFAQLAEDDDDFLVLRQGDMRLLSFESIPGDGSEGCVDVEFELVARGYYEHIWVDQKALAARELEERRPMALPDASLMPKQDGGV